MKKRIYTLALIAVSCAAITACGKKDDTTKAPSEQKTEATTPSDDGTEPDDDETTVPTEAPSDEESEPQTPTPESSPAESTIPPEETVPTTGSASGTFVGFVDTHTVEIVLDDGETISYQVKKDSVLDALQEMDENGETALSFKYKITADGDYIITKVK